jgi:hypothetical protein
MPFAKDQDVIQAVAPERSDQALIVRASNNPEQTRIGRRFVIGAEHRPRERIAADVRVVVEADPEIKPKLEAAGHAGLRPRFLDARLNADRQQDCANQKERRWNTDYMTNKIDAWQSRNKDGCDYAASHAENEKQHPVGYAEFLRHIR